MEGDASPVFRGAKGGAIVSLYQNGGYDESRNYHFDTRKRIMIVGKGQNMRCFSRFEWKFGIRWDIEFNLILERKELVAYPFNDIWRIVKRYVSGVLLFKKTVTYFSFTRHIYYKGVFAMKRRQIIADERWKVYIKDNGICQICGKPLTYEEMTIDHIIPLVHGGVNQISNFQCACRSCNQFKQNFSQTEFYEMITEIYWYQTKMKCGADFTEKLNRLLLAK